jgi:hypothetical protein
LLKEKMLPEVAPKWIFHKGASLWFFTERLIHIFDIFRYLQKDWENCILSSGWDTEKVFSSAT